MSEPVEAIGKSSAFGRLLGLEIVKADAGEAVLRLSMHDGLRNLHGKLHGGALFSLIDSAMGQASHSLTDGTPSSVTLECKVNYIRARQRRRSALPRLAAAQRQAHPGARSRSASGRQAGRQGTSHLRLRVTVAAQAGL